MTPNRLPRMKAGNTASPPGSRRSEELDTLRFVAALAVVVGHSNVIFRSFTTPWPLLGFTNTYSAVALFFVLSGCVLHQSCKRKPLNAREYGAFVARRVFRLYPLHIVALLLGGAVLLLPLQSSPLLMASEYARETVVNKDHHNLVQWMQQVLLIGGGMDSTFVNPPVWTLAVEMRLSLLLPMVSFFVIRSGLRAAAAAAALSMLLGPWLARTTLPTAGMLPLFVLGAFLSEVVDATASSRRDHAWLMAPGLLIYNLGEWTGRATFGRVVPFYVAGIGAALMILATVRSRWLGKALAHPVLVLLGQCSYGIYLLHFPLLLAVIWALEKLHLPPLALLPMLVPLTLALAWVFYLLVEKPFIAWGRHVSAWVAGSRRRSEESQEPAVERVCE
jgi:peptidoglycan/LPS O-acetylase OafA/YrhL